MEKNYLDWTLDKFLEVITDTTHTKDGYVFDEISDTEIYNFFDAKIKTLDIKGIKSMLECIEYYYDNAFSRNSNKPRYDIYPYIQRKNVISKIIDMLKNKLTERQATQQEPSTTPQQITLPDNLLQALQQAGFIENAAAKPLKWIKSISTTKGINTNKRALLDLLCFAF